MASLDELRDTMETEKAVSKPSEYDCIFLVVGHSNYDTDEPEYKKLSDLEHFKKGCTIKTIIPANIGITCYVDNVDIQEQITKLLQEDDYFGLSPEEILDQLNGMTKATEGHPAHPSSGYVHREHEEYCRFLECSGAISKNPHRYYNKLWVFDDDPDEADPEVLDPKDAADPELLGDPEQYGCILLFARLPSGRVIVSTLFTEEIKTGTFATTKEELLDFLFKETPWKRPLFLDLGCSIATGSKKSVRKFERIGIYGGKRTRKFRK
jgi:hypothetical protein